MLKNYIKIALKVLMRRKLYTLISLVGISITLMVLIVATAVLDTVYGQSIFETKRSRTLGVYTIMLHQREIPEGNHIFPSYKFLTRQINIKTLDHVQHATVFTLIKPVASYHDGRRFKIDLRHTDGDYWHVFDYDFLEGGPYTPEDEQNARFAAVINQTIRKKIFGDEPALGKLFEIEGQRYRVSGVVRDIPKYRQQKYAEAWVPVTTLRDDAYLHDGLTGWFRAAVLAESRRQIPLVRESYRSRVAAVKPDHPSYRNVEAELETFFQVFTRMKKRQHGEYGTTHTRLYTSITLLLMFCFMLIPAINLVNINVSRILERASEIGVRKAFGASSRALVGQFIVENIVLTLIGGALGLAFSAAMLQFLNRSGWIPYARFQINFQILIYGMVIILLFAILSGIYPAWKMSRLHPVDALRGGGG